MATPAQALATAPIPPQNLDAEESVLGAMMLSPLAIGAVTESTNLSAADFYRESHGHVYKAILALYAKGEPVDAITVVDELDRTSTLDGAGGAERVHELAALVPAASNAAHYARIVSEMATLRGLIRAGNDIARLGFDRPGETVELVDRAEAIVFDLSQQRVSTEFAHIDDLLKESFETITKLYEAGSDITGTASGFRDARPADVRLPAGQPDHRRRAPVDGEVGARALHGLERGGPARDTGRAVHARDVEGRGDAAADVRGGQGRVAAPAHRQARRRRLAASHGRLRQALEGADLRRRHRLDHDDGDPVEAAAPEDARAGRSGS